MRLVLGMEKGKIKCWERAKFGSSEREREICSAVGYSAGERRTSVCARIQQ